MDRARRTVEEANTATAEQVLRRAIDKIARSSTNISDSFIANRCPIRPRGVALTRKVFISSLSSADIGCEIWQITI
ncbi:MAG: hypothetical protein WAM42_08855 [Candidatus Nitrosopolaris sp.]